MTPLRFVALLLATIFVAEVGIMFALPVIVSTHASKPVAAGVDALLLVVILAPGLWWMIIRPLQSGIVREQQQAVAIMHGAFHGIITIDEAGSVESVNPEVERLFGFREEELLGKPVTLLMPERYRERHQAGLDRARSTAMSPHEARKILEAEGLRKDGSEFQLELSMTAWQSAGVRKYAGFVRDITARKRTEAEVRDNEQRYRVLAEKLRETSDYLENLFDSANAPIVVWSPGLRITRFNHACERLTGFTASEVVGQELRMLFPEESREESLSKIAYALGGEDRESPEIPILRKNGGIRIVLWNSANIRSGDGTAVIATIAQGQDITERKQAEQMKADFVSFTTHQLRTPLSGIRWLLELAEQGEGLPEEVASLVVDARTSTERLISLVNDLLAVSRIEGGQLAVQPQQVDLSGMTTDVINELLPLVREKNHQISLPNGVSAPRVYADPKLVREVVLNLLSNAIKYTPKDGSITVSMKAERDMVQWAVHDTGIGIPVDAQHRLFQKFYRAENATIINTEGAGLGLYLVRLVLERSGGRVWCESEESGGSTFTFTLPMAREGAASEGR